jgi:hypothetical protein
MRAGGRGRQCQGCPLGRRGHECRRVAHPVPRRRRVSGERSLPEGIKKNPRTRCLLFTLHSPHARLCFSHSAVLLAVLADSLAGLVHVDHLLNLVRLLF